LSSLIRNSAVPRSDSWVVEVLEFLALHGLFRVKKKSEKSTFRHVRIPAKPAFSEVTRSLCCTKLLGCLADLTGAVTISKLEDGKGRKATGVAEDGTLWVTKVVTSIRCLEGDTKHVNRLAEVNDEQRVLWTRAHDTIAQIQASSPPQTSLMQAGELLLSATLLQRYCNGDEETDGDETLEVSTEDIPVCLKPICYCP
jgi:DNA polymerase phi